MTTDQLNETEELALNIERVQSEPIAFDSRELVTCTGCTRANPPTRLSCLYCGRELDVDPKNAESIKPVLRKLEGWEKGFNLIYRPVAKPDEDTLTKTANFLGREASDIKTILDTDLPLPIARVETNRVAELLAGRLEELGVGCSIISDEQLDPGRLPTRLRSLQIEADKLILKDFNTAESTVIEPNDLALVVKGAVFQSRTESVKTMKRGGKGKVLDQTPTFSDEVLIDIYRKDDPLGFRIFPHGFDFSCLGNAKRMLAVENIQILQRELEGFAAGARIVTDYLAVRESLGQVWEILERSSPQGLRRQGFGKFGMGNVAMSNNLDQFTRYSRLQWYLL
jgi:hypothetical protein